MDRLGDTGLSFIQSFPEMLGIEPSQRVQAFRSQHPIAGFATQLAGLAVPYLGAEKGLSMIPRARNLISAVEALGGESAFARAALKYGSTAGLVEAGRLGVAATPVPGAVSSALYGEDQSTTPLEMLPGSALNVLGGGLLGGLGGLIGSRLAKGPRIGDVVPEARPDFAISKRLGAIDDRIALHEAGTVPLAPELLTTLQHEQGKLTQAILGDISPSYNDSGQAQLYDAKKNWEIGRIVNPLVGEDAAKPAMSNWLNSLFKPSSDATSIISKKTLNIGDTGFRSADDLGAITDALGVSPEELARNVVNARVIEVKPGSGAPARATEPLPSFADLSQSMTPEQAQGRRLLSSDPAAFNAEQAGIFGNQSSAEKLAKGLDKRFNSPKWTPVSNGWRMVREADNGLWVAMRKIDGEAGVGAPGDKYVVVRTANPDFVDPQGAAFRNALVYDEAAFWPGAREFADNNGVPLWDRANLLEKDLRPYQYNAKVRKSATESPGAAMAREAGDLVAAYAAPTMGWAARNPRAGYIVNFARQLMSEAQAYTSSLMDGVKVSHANKSIAGHILSIGDEHTGGLRQKWKGLSRDALNEIQTVAEEQTPYEKVVELHSRGIIGDQAFDVLTTRHKLFNVDFPNQVATLAKDLKIEGALNAIDGFEPLKGHYGFTRSRPGGFKAMVEDEAGNLVGLTSGNTAGDARKAAQELIDKEALKGKPLRFGGMYDETSAPADTFQRLKAAISKPGFLRERSGLLGYEQSRKPWTAGQLIDDTSKNLAKRQNLLANVVLQEKLWPVVNQLNEESRVLGGTAESYLRRLQGDDGDFAKFQNHAMDKVLGGVLGKDSASTIVRTTQKLLTAFQFGFGNLGQVALHAADLVQTQLPEIAFQLGTGGRGMVNAGLYDTMPLVAGGRVQGSFNAMSPFKIMGEAMGLVHGKNVPEDFTRVMQDMVSQGIAHARYAEEQFGSSGEILKAGPKEAGWGKWANATNELLISKTEEYSRAVGIANGYLVGKELGLEGRALSNFTRQFVEKTSFSYGTADKPRIFTTPVGSLLGTFKSWMFHYMANMLKYSTSGREGLPALLLQTGMTGAIAGGVGMPLLMPIANGASKWLTDKSFMQNVYDGLGPDREDVGDALFYGLPSTLGLSFASQAASPGADPSRDASMLYSFSVWDRMKHLGTGTQEAMSGWAQTGISPFANPSVRDELVRALAPKTLYRALSLSQGNAIRSMNSGYRVMDNVSIGDAALYAAGFNPVELEKTFQAYNEIKDDQAAKKATMKGLGEAMANAIQAGDQEEMTRIYARTTALGLDTSTVLRSAEARNRRAATTQLDYAASAQDKEDFSWMFDGQ